MVYKPKLALRLERGGDRDSIVECQTQRFVRFVIALAAVEEVLVEIVPHGEETAAGRIGGSVYAVWTGDAAGDCT